MTVASQEAVAALEQARCARAENEALVPIAAQLGDRVREQVRENHFYELFEQVVLRGIAS